MDASFAGPVGLGAGGLIFAALASRVATARTDRRFPPHGRIVTIEGARVHIVDPLPGPDASRPVVVLLHGAFGCALDWRTVQDQLVASGVRAIAVDRPGHGHSDRPAAVMLPSDQAAWLRNGLAGIGIDRIDVLAGFSLGGAVALAWALDHFEQVRALALVNPATHPWGTGHSPLYDLLGVPLLGPVISCVGLSWVARRLAAGAVERGFDPQPIAAGYRSSGVVELATRPASLRANANDIRTLDRALARQSARYPTLRPPTSVLVSRGDRVVGPAIHAERLAAAAPRVQLAEVADGGHQLPWSRTDRVAGAIRGALERR